MTKTTKYNPKPNKTCVGDYLFALNRQLADLIDKSPSDDVIKACQYQIMNEIFIQVAQNWCKCPSCKSRAISLIEIIRKYQDAMQEEENVDPMPEA